MTKQEFLQLTEYLNHRSQEMCNKSGCVHRYHRCNGRAYFSYDRRLLCVAFAEDKPAKPEASAEIRLPWHGTLAGLVDEIAAQTCNHPPVRGPQGTKSYKVAIKTRSGHWYWQYNGIRFAQREEAEDYGESLSERAEAHIIAWEVQESDEEVTRPRPEMEPPLPSEQPSLKRKYRRRVKRTSCKAAGKAAAKNSSEPVRCSRTSAQRAEALPSWEEIRKRDENGIRQMREEDEIRDWILSGDDRAALLCMKKYLPMHWATANELKDIPLDAPFFAIRVLGVARRRTMNEIITSLENGDEAEALRLMKKRLHVEKTPYELPPETIQ